MTAPFSLLLAFLGLVVSARVRLTAIIFGQPVSIPVIGLVAAAVVLLLAALVLVLLRLLIRDGFGLRPKPVKIP